MFLVVDRKIKYEYGSTRLSGGTVLKIFRLADRFSEDLLAAELFAGFGLALAFERAMYAGILAFVQSVGSALRCADGLSIPTTAETTLSISSSSNKLLQAYK